MTETSSVDPSIDQSDIKDPGAPLLGARIRRERMRQGLGVRQLARQVDCSASLISQIELGKANPSVSTLYAIANELNIAVDSLFSEPVPSVQNISNKHSKENKIQSAYQEQANSEKNLSPNSQFGEHLIRRKGDRLAINLDRGVRWELLSPTAESDTEFMEVTYAPGGGSKKEDHSIQHNGREYSIILDGVLSVQIGFETFELSPGDSMAFDSTVPHHFWNAGEVPVRAVWFVLDRWNS